MLTGPDHLVALQGDAAHFTFTGGIASMNVNLQQATGDNGGRTELLFAKRHKLSVNHATHWLE